MKLRTATGEVRIIRVSTAVGEFLGTDVGQAIILDVTDTAERERQLQLLEQWLRHNIRNETTVIAGLAEQIEAGVIEDPIPAARTIRSHAMHLVDQANREREIIGLLSESMPPEPTAIRPVVDSVVEACRSDAPDARIELTDAEDVTALAVPEIEAALRELLENAVEHTEDPRVEVAVRRDPGGGAVVDVADHGPGIPERERTHLVLDREVTPLDHGTGLGLLFVHWVVRLSGGDIEFTEDDPRGSVVTIRLPGTAA